MFECSNVSDCLGDMLRGLVRAGGESGKQRVECDTENHGVWVVTLRRVSESLELTLRHSSGIGDGSAARSSRVKLRHRGSWQDGVGAIAGAYRRLLDEHGEQGYAEHWGHAFPSEAFATVSQGQ